MSYVDSVDQAVNFATEDALTDRFPGLCDHFVGLAYGRPNSGYAHANAHWDQTPQKFRSSDKNPPVGALVFWDTGKKYGHVAIVTGKGPNGPVVTTTHLNNGKPTQVPLSSIGMKYKGWTVPYFQGQTTDLSKFDVKNAADMLGDEPTKGTAAQPAEGMYFEQDPLKMKDLKQTWGIAAGVLKKFPELKDVLKTIISKNITDPVQQQALLNETNWFKKHTSDWMEIEKGRLSKDPALWDAAVEKRAASIMEQFTASGATIDKATATKYAEQMIYGSGWNGKDFEIYDEAYLKDAMADAIEFSVTPDANGGYDLKGKAEETSQALYELAHQYGLDTSMSNAGFTSWFEKSMKGLMSGKLAQQDVDDELVNNALSMYPGLASQLQRGLTLRQAADPYLTQLENQLELGAGSLDLSDDLVQRVLNTTNEKGEFKPMSLYDTKLLARKDERWQYTSKAKQEYTDIGSKILSDFGFLG